MENPPNPALPQAFQRSWGRRFLPPLALAFWPLLFILWGFHYFPGVPLHNDWDNFNYLRASKQGNGYVGLGMGRTVHCWTGQGFEAAANALALPPLFGGFRVWVLSLLCLQGVMLFLACGLLARRIGYGAGHVFGALMATHTGLLNLFLANWPENPALIGLFAAAMILMANRPGPWPRLAAGLALAILMLLLKEVTVYYIPALTILAYAALPGRMGGWKRIAAAGAWAGTAVFALYLANRWILPAVVPGLAEIQEHARSSHFEGIAWSAERLGRNLRLALLSAYSPALYILAACGAARFAFSLVRRTATTRATALFLFGAALAGVPLVFAVALGIQAVPRYAIAMVPGLCLLGASLFMHPWPQWLETGRRRLFLTASVCLLILALLDKGPLRRHYKAGIKDKARYARMARLRPLPLALAVDSDTWPAHYVNLFAGDGSRENRWQIYWPSWHGASNEKFDKVRDWIRMHAAQGRIIAIGSGAERIHRRKMERILKDLAPLRFEKDPCGWWISTGSRRITQQSSVSSHQ